MFHVVDAADAEEGVRKLLALVRERIPKRFVWVSIERGPHADST